MPLELCVNGVDNMLAVYVDTGLCEKDTGRDFPIEALRKEMYFLEARKNTIPDADFKRRGSYLKYGRRKKSKENWRLTGGTVRLFWGPPLLSSSFCCLFNCY